MRTRSFASLVFTRFALSARRWGVVWTIPQRKSRFEKGLDIFCQRLTFTNSDLDRIYYHYPSILPFFGGNSMYFLLTAHLDQLIMHKKIDPIELE